VLRSQLLPVELEGYALDEELHRGKRTTVYRGMRERDGVPVVVKVLNRADATFTEMVRLHHEHAIASGIQGNGVVRCLGFERQHQAHAIVFEDFGGISLAKFLAGTRLDLAGFLHLATRLCAALQDIHAAHVIHLDINPSNVIINSGTQQLKITDFGISSRLSLERVQMVNPGVLEGTLPYISPEQTGRMNRAVDYRADFYSLGITLYEALVGWVPFQSPDPMELLHCHMAKQPLAPAGLNLSIPKPVSDIVMKLLAKTAEQRYQSAGGVRADFEHCLEQWNGKGSIAEFPLGLQDASGRLQIPQKLYGRDEEIATLFEAFDHVCSGRAGVVLVSGDAGIGKSALVNELHRSIAQQRGFFIAGKFDQFKHDVPYLPFTAALRELTTQLLASDPETLRRWRERLLDALGPNGAVVSAVVPEIELIIGEQPPLQNLPPKESQNRFTSVILNFIQAVASGDHPLVLFQDDLQWADQASLELIQQILAAPDPRHLLFIGAYRDEEAGAAALRVMFGNLLRASGVSVTQLSLAPLSVDGVNQLIAEALRLRPETSLPLATLVSTKTAGNPYFVAEFLKALYHDGLLQFDQEERRWSWSIEEIGRKDFTENVVTMMAGNIRRLPEGTQRALQLAACIGNSFDLESLAHVRGLPPPAVAGELWPAITDGLLIPLGNSCKYIQSAGETERDLEGAIEEQHADLKYKFAHDRVQQSAYSLIPESERSRIHYRIGESLRGRLTRDDGQDLLFAATGHLNLGSRHIREDAARQDLIRLNLRAGNLAMASAAFQPALSFFAAGCELVAPDDNTALDQTVCDLLMHRGECEYLTGDFPGAERSFDVALQHVKSAAERGRIHGLKVELYIHQSQIDRALATALEALRLLGVPLPVKPGKATVLLQMLFARWRLGRIRIADLVDLPLMTREEPRVAMNILMSLFSIAYSLSKEFSAVVISRMMNLTLQHGNADISAYTYGLYGLLVSTGFRAYDAGGELGALSLSVSRKFDNRLLQGRCNFVYGCLHNHWYHHASTDREYHREAYRLAMENGDLLYASYALSQESIIDMVTGVPLPTVYQNASGHLTFTQGIHHDDIALYFEAAMIWSASLIGEGEATGSVSQGRPDKAGFLERLQASAYVPPKMFFRYVQLQLHYLRGEYDQALNIVRASAPMLHALAGQLVEAEYRFYRCLTFLAIAGASSGTQRRVLLREAAQDQRVMHRWARLSPANFAHKRDLLAAERARATGAIAHAMSLYDQAIAGAREQGFLQDEGLSNERAGEFYLALGRERVASSYLTEARACYETWGASGLVDMLERRHKRLVPPRSDGQQTARGGTSNSSSTSRTGAHAMDLISVLKASQTLSGEIRLPQLLGRMMHIVLENAGAERGVLVMENAGKLLIEAEGAVGSDAPVVLQALPLEASEHVSEAIVRYVARVRENVVLDDAGVEGQFVSDPYVQRTRAKSILCMPIQHQGKLGGILFLENSLATHTFTPARLEVLRLLSTQIAVSMENARLYAQERELARIQEEVRLAASIQQELLPQHPPVIEGYEITGRNIPAMAVGGDYFDFIRIDDHRLAVCIGDVSGKGVPASLLMANLQASLRAQSLVTSSPRECLINSNRLLFESTSPEKFATLFYGVLDVRTHTFAYCNAGHEHPLLIDAAGGCRELSAGGIALGMLESFPFEEAVVPFAPGDLLVMYSDGVTEAMDMSVAQFGRAGLEAVLAGRHDLSLDGLTARLVDAVREHAGSAPQSDDITVVAIRRPVPTL
jgi:predicted ATPase/serine phosphatase RsbU (regulator of sigma subunit)/tRNA A-37 threonylcarbamoyl transferase component Bud32